jgi:HlyD family secretion protein/adhesin transport system membrane fusion protein
MNLATWLTHSDKGGDHGPPRTLTLPLDLESGAASSWPRRMMVIGPVTLVALLLWASLTPIRELAIAQGQIVPDGQTRVMQHLEGGIVSELLVKEGETVEAGQPLMRLDPVQPQTDLSALHVRAANLRLQRERLEALLNNQSLASSPTGAAFPGLAADQQDVFRSRLAWRLSEQQALKTRIDQRKSEIATLKAELESLNRLATIQDEQVAMREVLVERGYVSRRAYLESKAAAEQVRGQISTAEGRLNSTQDTLREAEAQLALSDADARRIWQDESSRLAGELAEVLEGIRKAQDRVERLVLRSPVQSIVQQIVPRSIGEIIRPGEVIIRLVPVSQTMLAEVQVKPEDVGHIKIGDHVEIKITTFDSTIYGDIKGAITTISPSTFQQENGQIYYKATIQLDKNHLGTPKNPSKIIPGMVVRAEIITGKKSLAQYILKPIYKNLQNAFTER